MHHTPPPFPSDRSDSSRLHFEPVLRLEALTELNPTGVGPSLSEVTIDWHYISCLDKQVVVGCTVLSSEIKCRLHD